MASDVSAFVRRVLAHPSTPEGDAAARKDATDALVGAPVEFQAALYNTVGGLHRRMAALLRAVEGSLRDAAAAEGVANVLRVLGDHGPFRAHAAKFQDWKPVYYDPMAYVNDLHDCFDHGRDVTFLELKSPDGKSTFEVRAGRRQSAPKNLCLHWKDAPKDDRTFEQFWRLLALACQSSAGSNLFFHCPEEAIQFEAPASDILARCYRGNVEDDDESQTLYLHQTLSAIVDACKKARAAAEKEAAEANERVKRLRKA